MAPGLVILNRSPGCSPGGEAHIPQSLGWGPGGPAGGPLGGVNRVFYGGFGNRELTTLKGICACVVEDLTSICFHR